MEYLQKFLINLLNNIKTLRIEQNLLINILKDTLFDKGIII
jgi:uncharacterized protein YaaW (UPF0174 family)